MERKTPKIETKRPPGNPKPLTRDSPSVSFKLHAEDRGRLGEVAGPVPVATYVRRVVLDALDAAEVESEQSEPGEDTPHPDDSPEMGEGNPYAPDVTEIVSAFVQSGGDGAPVPFADLTAPDGTVYTAGPARASLANAAQGIVGVSTDHDLHRNAQHALRHATGLAVLVHAVHADEADAIADFDALADFYGAEIAHGDDGPTFEDAGWTGRVDAVDGGFSACLWPPPGSPSRRDEVRGILAAHGHDWSERAIDDYLGTGTQTATAGATR